MLTNILVLALWTAIGMMTGGALILVAALTIACVAGLMGWSVDPLQ